MPNLLDTSDDAAKMMLIGRSGAGKTGAQASLVAAGYKLRIIDTDKGIKSLRSLLTDPRYPYAKIIADKKIDLREAVSYIPFDIPMSLRTVTRQVGGKSYSETLLAPKDARAWMKVLDQLNNWRDGEINYGPADSWGNDVVLSLDSFSTLAYHVYYFSQSLNNRLGARDEGRDYQRDVGAAQAQLRRLLEMLSNSSIKCNVIIISHVTWVDESQGVAARPREATADGNAVVFSQPDGYPSAIGRALSPQMGKYFNDVYVMRSSGSGANVRRSISTVPFEGVVAKNSVYLKREYDISTGLAEIFAALRGQPEPTDLIAAINHRS